LTMAIGYTYQSMIFSTIFFIDYYLKDLTKKSPGA